MSAREWTYLSEYERGALDGLTAALSALDGHGLNNTAHDCVRRLLACGECDHQPGKHGADGCCTERIYFGPGPLVPCHCIEWEPKALPQVAS